MIIQIVVVDISCEDIEHYHNQGGENAIESYTFSYVIYNTNMGDDVGVMIRSILSCRGT